MPYNTIIKNEWRRFIDFRLITIKENGQTIDAVTSNPQLIKLQEGDYSNGCNYKMSFEGRLKKPVNSNDTKESPATLEATCKVKFVNDSNGIPCHLKEIIILNNTMWTV